MTLSLDQRIAGVLAPVFALRGKHDLGIGDTAALIEFIDWAASVGFRLVKILPINETGGHHSPYDAISSLALEPTTITTQPGVLPHLSEDDAAEVLREENAAALAGGTVHYPAVKRLKQGLLERAFERFNRRHFQRRTAHAREFEAFVEAQAGWIADYALFRALVEANGHECWDRWEPVHRTPAAARQWLGALPARKAQALAKRIRFFTYIQWIAFGQWRRVKAHAASRGVALMGDIPFGVSYYSADVWAHPALFRADWCGGTGPDKIFKHDAFVQKWGQNWGIPLYDWDAMRREDFRWWRQRVHGVREFFDLFRIDHVLGFYRIYGFPWRPERNGEFLPLSHDEARQRTPGGELPRFTPRADDTWENKDANRREGEEYLRVVVSEAGEGRVIGEDLGEVPDYVRPNLTALGIAGYKIPAWEMHDGRLIPGRDYQRLSLVTYGTHDHEPLRALWERLVREAEQGNGHALHELRLLCDYAGHHEGPDGVPRSFTPGLHHALLRALFESNSWIAVVMITDLFGRSERFNYPGVASSDNWTQRLHAPVAELHHEPRLDTWRELLRGSGRSG